MLISNAVARLGKNGFEVDSALGTYEASKRDANGLIVIQFSTSDSKNVAKGKFSVTKFSKIESERSAVFGLGIRKAIYFANALFVQPMSLSRAKQIMIASGFIVSASSFEDEQQIYVASVRSDRNCLGHPEMVFQYFKGKDYYTMGGRKHAI